MKKAKAIKPQILLIMLVTFFAACNGNSQVESIKVYNRQILLNNKPYLIKGVCYHPVPQGSNARNFFRLEEDLKLMKEVGINTIRVYEPIDDKNVLDAVGESGIKIIMGFGYNQEGHFDILSGSFIDYINKYKDHKAILFWELGNEYNYHPEWFEGDIKNWYTALNNAADSIHTVDTSHPVSTAHGELPDSLALLLCPNIDIWGMNVYRWDKPGTIFSEWKKLSSKPMYLSEAGADSYMTISRDGYEQGNNEKAQADAIEKIIKDVFKSTEVCSGIALYAFTDEWWKAGNNDAQDIGGWVPNSSGVPYDGTPNEEYWGIVDINRIKKESFFILKKEYTKDFPIKTDKN